MITTMRPRDPLEAHRSATPLELLVVLGIPLLALCLPIELVVALIAAAAAGLVAVKTWLQLPG